MIDEKFFGKNGCILGKFTKGTYKFLLILTALFGHQLTYKNLRGNTDRGNAANILASMQA